MDSRCLGLTIANNPSYLTVGLFSKNSNIYVYVITLRQRYTHGHTDI